MARLLRFAPAGWPLHVWCRGNRQQDIFLQDADRRLYLDLLVRHCQENAVGILGYCLMRNHVHLVLEPSTDDGLTRSMMRLNSEYAQTMHYRMQVSGHFWQGRFKASVMDDRYFWTVMSYVELNPVRAGLVQAAERWMWSSAGAHLGTASWPDWLAREPFCSHYSADEWRAALAAGKSKAHYAEVRQAVRQNRPMADRQLVKKWEADRNVHLLPRGPGRPTTRRSRDRELGKGLSQTA